MLKDKIKAKENGIIFYGMTPPKASHTDEKIKEISQKYIDRIKPLDIDGLVLYDIQDESARTNKERPFPFMKTINPCEYSKKYLQELKIPRIIYRAIGKYTKETFSNWLEETTMSQVHSVFVGAASHNQKQSLNVKEAYALKKEINPGLLLGGIAIPERHAKKHDEHLRVFAKIDAGCEYFITQCVYDLESAKIFLTDYAKYAKEHNKNLVPIIFTLTPCGSAKTLDFMKWLGINIPNYLEEDLKESGDILQESVKLSRDIFKELYKFGIKKGIPIGCNIESVAIRKVEIDASIALLYEIKKIIKENK